jgi:hypothetical protein
LVLQNSNKFRKLRRRTFAELKTRGRQALSALAEQIGVTGKLPSNLDKICDQSVFGNAAPTAEDLLERFRGGNGRRFFDSLNDKNAVVREFQAIFGAAAAQQTVARANRAVAGKFDLLGFSNLDFGVPVDWNFEPVAGKHAAVQHWKKFNELDGEETGDKKIIWELNRHAHFFDFGAAYWLTGDERFAAAFVMHLTGWMQQNPVGKSINWMSSLEVGFRVVAWLWALHFFKDSPNLSPAIFADALRFLYAHGLHIEKYLSTFYSPNTHLTGEALALYYLGTLLPELKRARHWRKMGRQILLSELDKQILADGVYFEQSIWYHRYTADFYTHFYILSGLNSEEMLSVEHQKLETKLQLLLDFVLYTQRPDGTSPLIGDDDGGRLLPKAGQPVNDFRCLLSTGAALFRRGDYKYAAGGVCEETFWLLGANGVADFDRAQAYVPPENAKHFADGGYFAARDNWTPNANYFLFDGGRHGALGGGHAHADALSLELAVGGRTTLCDIGTYTYHESIEARNYFRSTAAHNTLTIDGASSSVPEGKFSWAQTTDAQMKEAFSHCRFDFCAARHKGFSRLVSATKQAIHWRGVLFVRGGYWILYDSAEIGGQHEYELKFHFAPDCKIENHENFIFNPPTAPGKNDGLKIFTFGDNGKWRVETDSLAPCYGMRVETKTATFASAGAGRQEFFTFLLPANAAHEHLRVKEIAARGGRGFVLDFGEFQDWLIYGDGEWVENDIFGSDFRFVWARFPRTTHDLAELILINGSKFNFNQSRILNIGVRTPYVYARRDAAGVLNFENFERDLGGLLLPNLRAEN